MDEPENINFELIMNEFESKYNKDKFNVSKFIKFLGEKNIKVNEFCFQILEQLKQLLFGFNNDIKEQKLFYDKSVDKKNNNINKILKLILELNHYIEEETSKPIIKDNIRTIIEIIINILIKLGSISDSLSKEKIDIGLKSLIENFIQNITEWIKILLEIDPTYISDYFFEQKNYNDFLIKFTCTRKILYEILGIVITTKNYVNINIKDEEQFMAYNGSLINDIIQYLIKEIKVEKINDYIQDVKHISKVFKDYVNLIQITFLKFLEKIMDLFNPNSKEMKACYEDLFFFLFNDCVFGEKEKDNDKEKETEKEKEKDKEKEEKITYNVQFIELLFKLYEYLLEHKNKPLIDIFLMKLLFILNNNFYNDQNKKDNLSFKRYNWLLTKTKYIRVVLDSFPIIFDERIFAFYYAILMNLSDSKSKHFFLPELDLISFFRNFEKYINNENYKKEYLITMFTKKIGDLIDNNIQISQIVLQKCNMFDIILKLIEKENEYNIKIKLIELIEKMISMNKEEYEYSFEIKVSKELNDEFNYRLNLISVGYEFDNSKFNQKITELISFLTDYAKDKKISEFIQLSNFIFKIICEYQFKKINAISDENILNFNNLFLQISTILNNLNITDKKDDENELEKIIKNFLSSIFKFIIKLNLITFDYKMIKKETKNPMFYTKRIFGKKILKNIIKNMLLSQNLLVKKKTLEYLFIISIDEKNNLIISSYILYNICKIYYQDKNYKSLQKIFIKLLNLIKNFEINAKILLNYDFITIALNILQELYGKEKEDEEYYKTTFTFLEEIAKYMNHDLLMKYLNKLFILFNKNILSEIKEQEPFEEGNPELYQEHKRENVTDYTDIYDANNINEDQNDINNEQENEQNNIDIIGEQNEKDNKNNDYKLCMDLFHIIKKNLENNNSNANYIILSNNTFHNHLINNLLFLDNLKYPKGEDIFLSFKLIIKLNSYKGIKGFHIFQFIDNKRQINFIINDDNSLEVKENNSKKERSLCKIKNFDNILCPDGKYHDIIVIFDTLNKCFEMRVDEKIIIEKSEKYENFSFDNFNIIIGFRDNLINDKANDINNKLENIDINNNNNKEKSEDVCFVYISYILVLNTLISDFKSNDVFNKEKAYSMNQNLLTYYYRISNNNYIRYIIADIDFKTENINLISAKNLRNKMTSKNFFNFSTANASWNRYLAYLSFFYIFNSESDSGNLYIISKNKNINEFISFNNLCELEKINKQNLCSKIFDNYNTGSNLINAYIIDFLLGFIFLMEKRFNELKNKEEKKQEKKESNEEEELEVGMALYGEMMLNNEEIVLDYILEILEIIFLFPIRIIINYFIDKNIIKLKYFFARNIFLIKNDEDFIEKMFKIFLNENIDRMFIYEQNYLFLSILNDIFLNINIFEKLDSTVQNIIINYLFKILSKIKLTSEISSNQDEIYNCMSKIVKSLLNIILFVELTTYENDEGKTQIDYIINCINLIIPHFLTKEKNKKYSIGKMFFNMFEICSNFQIGVESHLNKDIYQKYNYIFLSDNDYNEGYLEEKIEKLSKQIIICYNALNPKENENKLIQKKEKKSDKCYFCSYIKVLFMKRSEFIYAENRYEKLFKRFFRNYFHNFGDNSDIFPKNYYAWFLSLKETSGRMQNKIVLKENRIKHFYYHIPKAILKTLYFKYIIEKEKYKQNFKNMNKLFFYDQICIHKNLIKNIDINLEAADYYNCFIINKLHKIFSIFVIYQDRIHIYYNICLDQNGKIHLVKDAQVRKLLWVRNENEFKKELLNYIENNDKLIIDDIYEKEEPPNTQNIKPNLTNFNYNISYNFSCRVLPLKKINEIHKRDHLHIPNSLEIFLANGESYYAVFTPELRDLIFEKIISNIDSLYKNNSTKKIFKSQKVQTLTNKENLIYMRHTPIQYLPQAELENFLGTKKNYFNSNYKAILEENSFKDEICSQWTKNRISNYDYLMLLNTLSGRTLNDLSHYIIFPWIIKDFNTDILNWLSSSIYRDLSLPVYACDGDLQKIKSKYELLDEEKYYSGTFYSAHTFICYFLVRQHPFTEIHLEIQGARFDAFSRMFNGVEQLSHVAEKFQELIPHLFYLPELYIKLNYILEDVKMDDGIISNFELPIWSKDDPRKFSLILKKMLESKNVSKNLNKWIDLIFGYQQRGLNAEKAMNTYRDSCYPPSETYFDEIKKSGEIESYFVEKEELGYVGKQIFTKPHKTKEVNNESNETKKIFFNSDEKLRQLNINKIKESKLSKKIPFKNFNDIIYIDNPSLNYSNQKLNYQGGISSLQSIINLSDDNSSSKSNIKKIKELMEDDNFFILNKNYFLLRKYGFILTYNKKSIEIINVKDNDFKLYYLNIDTDISSLILNSKQTKIYVGFANGIINEYKIMHEDINNIKIKNDNKNNNDYIMPIAQYQLNTNSKVYENIFINNKSIKNKIFSADKKIINIYFKLLTPNNFSENNPHIYHKINLLALNEAHNILIVLDQNNIIYIISLNNNYKLMHRSCYLTKYKHEMKEILPLNVNGDFIIYSSYSVNLFSINGVPLCSLNLFDSEYESLSIITKCQAIFIHDVTLFTAHKDGYIIIWKIINQNSDENFDIGGGESYEDKKNKLFLKEYLYGYNFRNYANSGLKLKEYQIQRRFEQIFSSKLSSHHHKNNNYITFMKFSRDLDLMILSDNENNIYVMTNSDSKNRKNTLTNMFKQKCMNCNKEIIDIGIRPSLVHAKTQNYTNSISLTSNNKDKKKKLICEECEQKLKHTENFLYTY